MPLWLEILLAFCAVLSTLALLSIGGNIGELSKFMKRTAEDTERIQALLSRRTSTR